MSDDQETPEESVDAGPTGDDATVDVAGRGAGGDKGGDAKNPPAAELPEVQPSGVPVGGAAPLDRVSDLSVPVSVELGRTSLTVQQILELSSGAVVELDQSADAPVALFVHGKCVAKGEIVVVDDFYGVRITSVREA